MHEPWRRWRNALLMSPVFQRWAARLPLTRMLAQREAAALFDVVAGFVYSQVLLACVRGGLLEAVRERSCNESELSALLQMSPAAARTLLRAAEALELLESDGSAVALDEPRRWALGARGAALLGNPGVIAMIEHHAVLYRDLADPLAMLRAPRGQAQLAGYWPYAVREAGESVASEATVAYTKLMAESQQLVAEEILGAYPLHTESCVLDVGGGDGSFLRALAKRSAHVQLCLFDLPGVAAQARQGFERAGLAHRARVQSGDFTRDELPRGASLISFVRVLHDHDEPLVERLLAAAYRALPAGGRVLIAEPMAETRGAERMGAAYFGLYLWAMGSGRPRSREELTQLLEKAGFTSIREHPTRVPLQTRVLSAIKP
jgi:demethylspheroidene O-methyltransferase